MFSLIDPVELGLYAWYCEKSHCNVAKRYEDQISKTCRFCKFNKTEQKRKRKNSSDVSTTKNSPLLLSSFFATELCCLGYMKYLLVCGAR